MADYGAVARPYARAIFELAEPAGELTAWSDALAAAAGVMGDAQARRFLARPERSAEERAAFIASVAGELPEGRLLGSAQGRNLLALLAENDRLPALPEISAQFDELKARAERKVKVKLIAASRVEDGLADAVARALERRLGRAVDLELEVDETLIGGAIIRADDMVIDGSVRSRLQRLAETLVD